MLFENLASRLQETFRRLRGKGKLSEADVNEAVREVRLALLEADVNFKVVKDFVNRVKERAVGQEVLQSLTPGQQVVKIVYDELVELMGRSDSRLEISPKGPTVIMLVGLQGSGKTTTAGKLAVYLRKQGRRPLLVAADIYRPAAIKQLEVIGREIDIPVFSLGDRVSPLDIARAGVERARDAGRDMVIIDTAGRLHIDDELMGELEGLKEALSPQEILLVVDAMTGQDAVNVAEAFAGRLAITGVILTKLDGDTRGGAALSLRAVTGKPIKFVGMGEKFEALEVFYPDRMASRILGMGDVLSLIEKAQANLDLEKAREMERKLRSMDFTLEDFLDQLKQVRKMGPLDQLLALFPGANMAKGLKDLKIDEKELVKTEAIINSMTREERRNPAIIDGSRRRRIALGSGTKVQDVNRLLKQYEETRKLLKQLSSRDKGRLLGGKLPFFK